MSANVTVDFLIPSGALADFASDLNATGVLDVGDGTGLSSGTGSELFDGFPAWPGLCLEITTDTAGNGALPIEPHRRVSRDQWAKMEAPKRAATDAIMPPESLRLAATDVVAPVEPRRRVSRDEWAKVEAPRRAATDIVVPVEAVASFLRDPAISVDGAMPIEFWGTYVVSITLVLSDGRVVTFPVPTAPSD